MVTYKSVRSILSALVCLPLLCAGLITEDMFTDTLVQYTTHFTNKMNSQFEMMLDNWASNYFSFFNQNQETTPNPLNIDENTEQAACAIDSTKQTDPTAARSSCNTNSNSVNDSTVVETIDEHIDTISLNDTIMHDFYDKIRFLVKDPLPLPDHSRTNNPLPFLTMHGSTKNVEIGGLSGYNIMKVNVNLSNNSIVNVFQWPCIATNGQYELDIVGPSIHLFGNGSFSINVTDVSFEFDFGLRENFNKTLKLDMFDVDLKIGNISVNFENLLNGGSTGETANNFLREILPQAINFAIPQLKATLQDRVIENANLCLNHVYLQNLTNLIHLFVL